MLRNAVAKLAVASRRTAATLISAKNLSTEEGGASQHRYVAEQMIQYVFSQARSQRSGDSYGQAMLVLEQGAANLRGEESEAAEDALGVLLLAMSTLLYERGELQDAVEKLVIANQLSHASSAIRVAAWEGLVGLNLEAGQDVTSSVLADDCFQLLTSKLEGGVPVPKTTDSRAKAIKGLVNLVLGDYRSAESYFNGCDSCNLDEGKGNGNVALSYGEFLHATGNFSLAKTLYNKALQIAEEKDAPDSPYVAAANMVLEEVAVGAACSLGQLLSQSGNFSEAEELLTNALTRAENHFGSSHPKVAVILTCIALMYGHKAKLEASSSLLIQEGLYRKALDLLKAPSLDSDVEDSQVKKRDIVALARGGYGDILSVQENRRGEGEQMKKWAEASWRNRRLSLVEALEFSEPSKAAVIDTRISRVL